MGRLHPRANFLDVHLANSNVYSPSAAASLSSSSAAVFATPSNFFSGVVRPSVANLAPLRIQPREEPTRIQLQRQRIQEQHSKTLVSTTDIPGLKTSVAFFASLRTNLRLHASPPPSPLSTPSSMRGSTTSLPPPSPLSVSVPIMETEIPDLPVAEDPLAGVPELNSYLATGEIERTDALKLVADSVAQQRQAANRALIYHPLNVATFVALMAVLYRYMQNRGYDVGIIATTVFGILMTLLVSCRYFTQGYVFAAEEINWEWLGDADILVTKFGDEVIGTVVIEWQSGESRKKGKKAWRGLIRAWTVRMKYRGKGVGGSLLEDAVKEAKKKGAESLEFAEDHANSKRVLPRLYNGAFDRQDRRSREGLQDLLETSPAPRGGRKRL